MLKFLLLCVILNISNASFIHPVDDETYKILVKLCSNEFAVPVATRSSTEKAAVLKFWRGKGKFSAVNNILCYDGKRVRISFNLILLFFRY